MSGRRARISGRIATGSSQLTAAAELPKGVDIAMRGIVESMRASFKSFAIGLALSLMLLYLILVAQFRSFTDPFLILLAFPPGLTGVLLTLYFTGTTLNVMSLMGIVMLAGITMSDSILIVEFAHHLLDEGHAGARRGDDGVPRASAAHHDDDAGNHHRPVAHGAEDGRRQRGLRAAGAGAGRRPQRFGILHRAGGARGILPGLPESRTATRALSQGFVGRRTAAFAADPLNVVSAASWRIVSGPNCHTRKTQAEACITEPLPLWSRYR